MLERYGAEEDEWEYFSRELGLTADLLPVVSNPKAIISPQSNMKALGKTPSIYNKSRKVAGIPDWTNYKATEEDINKWKKEPDYGICVQTRYLRAIDIDVPERALSSAITKFINGLQIPTLPKRFREDSGKCLLTFFLPGEIPKKIIRVEGGIIEFLGTGNQFVAQGTHQSGVKYDWEWGTAEQFPELSLEQLDKLWAALVKEFGMDDISQTSENYKKRNPKQEAITVHDSVVTHLRPRTDKRGSDGQIYIECPFKSEHTTDSGISETAYFPAGTRGYETGHFVCLHAHCRERDQADFLDALHLRDNDFDALPEESKGLNGDAYDMSGITRTKSGYKPILNNLRLALIRPPVCGWQIAYDTFRDDIMLSLPNSELAWRPLEDNDYNIVQCRLETEIHFKAPIAKDLLRNAFHMAAKENQFDSAQLWLKSLHWDGKTRIHRFMADYMGTEDNLYAAAVSRYTWTALAGRIMHPGLKADMVPIWVGPQGIMKSSAAAAMSPSNKFFASISFHEKDDDLARKMRGKLIAEIGELRGFQIKEIESIKDFVSRTEDTWIPKYMERTTTFQRRLLFIGTTNHEKFLNDPTGERRWLPIELTRIAIDKIITDRDQLWAEALITFSKSGLDFREAEKLAPVYHGKHKIEDPWQEEISDWLNGRGTYQDAPLVKGYITLQEVMKRAIGMEAKNMKGGEARKIGDILRNMGFERKNKYVEGKTQWVWIAPDNMKFASDLV